MKCISTAVDARVCQKRVREQIAKVKARLDFRSRLGLSDLSFRSRLRLVFIAFLLLMTILAGILLFFQFRLTLDISHVALQHQHDQAELLTQQIQQRHLLAIRIVFGFLSGLILFSIILGNRILRMTTRPLERLTSLMDGLDLEDEIPSRVAYGDTPVISEVSSVAQSFDRLLDRLRGYKALNIRRILYEKKRTELVAAQISDGICLVQDEKIIYSNPVAKKILSHGIASAYGGGFARAPRHLSFQKDLESERIPVSEGAKAILRAMARPIPVELAVEDEGRVRHYLIQASLLSEDRSSYRERQESRQILVVAQDVTLVKESQDAKAHFLGTISHEIKTPVTSLTMAIRLLDRMLDRAKSTQDLSAAETAFISETEDLIQTCVDDIDRLGRLLDEFLNASKLDTMAQKVESRRVEFIKLIRYSVQNFQGEAMERGVSLNFKTLSDRRPIWLSVDPTKITWALSNLLTNAIRHSGRSGRVDVTLERLEDRVEVKIRDTGPGIEESRQEKIFEKFSPYYDIRVARSGGAGLGLSIAREIISAHGGKIWVSSTVGSGTEFSFYLPISDKKASDQFSESDSLKMPKENQSKGDISGTSACSG